MTCHDIFKTARAERAKYPLTEGRYKLEEALRAIKRWQDLVTTIEARVRTGDKFGENENLGPCMANERENYLKELPEKLAHLIAYTILPAIAALEGDGVPKAEAQLLLHRAETVAQQLLNDCEAARLRLSDGIKDEYEAMKRCESELLGLLEAVDRLTQA